jgi:Tfp pilus assembly protein PilF
MDPNYELAYAGLAEAYILLGEPFNVGLPPKEALWEAKAAATKALDIDGTLSEAYLSLAHVIALHEWDWLIAEREYKRAIELNPNSATAHRGYSIYLQQMGRHSEAIAEIRRAAELDPLNDLIKANFGFVFYTAREYDQAIEQFRRVGQHIGLGWAYEEKKMYQEAIAELQKGSTVDGTQDHVAASLGHAYALSGKRIEAQKLLDDLQGRSKERYVSPYLISKIYIGLDEKDQAFAWLGKGYDAHDQWMVWLKSDPQMDSLRSDPRFVELIRRVGL